MSQKIVVNGTEYDSPEAMPPDVRRQYERALQLMGDVGKGSKQTVETGPDGVLSVKFQTKSVQYNVNGKTYDDPATLPPEVRERVDRAMASRKPDAVNLEVSSQVYLGAEPPARRIGWWLLIGAIVALAIWAGL